jgi:putative DNA primase/helicase
MPKSLKVMLNQRFTEASAAHREHEPGGLDEWYERTKSGGLRFMPGILAKHLSKHVHAFYCTEQYYFYEGGVYTARADKDAKAFVLNKLREREALMNHVNDAEGQWQLKIRKPVREINPNPFIINCCNGLYNVLTDKLEPHDPGYYSTVQLKANYAPEAQCPRFMEFLRSVLEEPEIDLLQEIFGYFLVPVTRAQKSFLLCGLPNVGKSKVLATLQDILLGAENVSNIPMQNLSDRFQPAELFGKMANIYADLSDKHLEDAGMFKAVTGEDYITGERKHKDPFSFKPYARFLYSCNEIPRNYGDRSDAFYRRLIIIRFSKEVPEEIRDPLLFEKLELEGDGVLAWAILGLKRLIANNWAFNETDRTKTELRQYKIENSSVLSFVVDCCTLEAGAVCYRKELYAEYKAYCEDGGIKGQVGDRRFKADISGVPGVTAADEPITRRRIYRGIRMA